MKLKKISFFAALMFTGGLFLLSTCPLHAQRMGGGMGGSPQGQMPGQPQPGMNNPGMPNSPGMGQQNSLQSAAEQNFLSTMRRNNKAETELSKLAVKNSTNENVKKLAQQVITDNHRTGSALNNSASSANLQMVEDVPSQTKAAMKQMKKLHGTEFDKLYLSQMDGYIKNDQKTTSGASGSVNSPNLKALSMQLRRLADNRSQQLAQVAQSENFKFQ